MAHNSVGLSRRSLNTFIDNSHGLLLINAIDFLQQLSILRILQCPLNVRDQQIEVIREGRVVFLFGEQVHKLRILSQNLRLLVAQRKPQRMITTQSVHYEAGVGECDVLVTIKHFKTDGFQILEEKSLCGLRVDGFVTSGVIGEAALFWNDSSRQLEFVQQRKNL